MDKPVSKRLPLAIMLPLGLLPLALSTLLMVAANALDHAGTRQLFKQVFDTPKPTMSTVVLIVALCAYSIGWSAFLLARTRLNMVGIALLSTLIGVALAQVNAVAILIVGLVLELTEIKVLGYW